MLRNLTNYVMLWENVCECVMRRLLSEIRLALRAFGGRFGCVIWRLVLRDMSFVLEIRLLLSGKRKLYSCFIMKVLNPDATIVKLH